MSLIELQRWLGQLRPGGIAAVLRTRLRQAQAIGQAATQQGYLVLYRETHILLGDLAEAVIEGTRKQYVESISTAALLIIDDFGMRKLPGDAAAVGAMLDRVPCMTSVFSSRIRSPIDLQQKYASSPVGCQ